MADALMQRRPEATGHVVLALTRARDGGAWWFALSIGDRLSYGPISSTPSGLPSLADLADHLPHRMIGVDLVVAVPADGSENLEQAIRCSPWFAGARIHVYAVASADMMLALGLDGAAGDQGAGLPAVATLRTAVAAKLPGVDLARVEEGVVTAMAMMVAGVDVHRRWRGQFGLVRFTDDSPISMGPGRTQAHQMLAVASAEPPVAPPEPARPSLPRRQQQTDQPPGFLSFRQVADLLGVSISTVRRLVTSRELAVTGVGRQLRVARGEIDRYLRQNTIANSNDTAVMARAQIRRLHPATRPAEEEQWRQFADELGIK